MSVEVEEVSGKAAYRRFLELPFALHRDEPRWAPPVLAFERWRLDPQRNPFFDRGDAAYFLARRLGRPAGRVTAHVAERDADAPEGCFGFFDTTDDPDVGAALLDAAGGWLRERGCSTMTGPLSFTADLEAGTLVEGFDVPGVTGRPWHPPWYAGALEAWGMAPHHDVPTWRLAADPGVGPAPPIPPGVDLPPHAGPYADPALVLGDERCGIAAVPDLSAALRSAGVRGAWRLAARARRREWDGCTVVRLAGDPAVAVPGLLGVAAARGYTWVIAPWSPGAGAPEAVHRVWRASIAG